MDKTGQQKFPVRITEILPDTERTRKLYLARQEEENKKKKEKERKKDQEAKEKMAKMQQLMEEEKLKNEQEKAKREALRKRQEEKEQLILNIYNQKKGRFGNMILQLRKNKTPLEFTITGLSLKSGQIRILMNQLKNNMTLKILSMCRKNIQDQDAVDIAKLLIENKTLEKIELEGNNFGPEAAKAFGELISKNKIIRVIDLESNNLTKYEKDFTGIQAICEVILPFYKGIKRNTTLLCLNLYNTHLESDCSAYLADAISHNKQLIQVDIGCNRKMALQNVRRIQDALSMNYSEYKTERYNEFIERKRMIKEEDISQILATREEALQLAREGVNQRMKMKQLQNEEQWHQMRLEDEIRKQKDIAKLAKLAIFRSKKGRRRRGKMAKK